MAQCSAMLSADYPLVVSVLLAGLVGSVTHCSVMCSPLVASQMLLLSEGRGRGSLIGWYHAGRVLTYIVLGVIAVFASQWMFSGAIESYAHFLLLLAGVIFVVSAVLPQKTHSCCSEKMQGVQRWLNNLSWQRFGYLLRGMLMGLMPCGMVYAVLLVIATLSSAYQAAAIMFVFGITTLPMLHISGLMVLRLGRRYPHLSSPVSRGVMALNGLFLCVLGTGVVSVS